MQPPFVDKLPWKFWAMIRVSTHWFATHFLSKTMLSPQIYSTPYHGDILHILRSPSYPKISLPIWLIVVYLHTAYPKISLPIQLRGRRWGWVGFVTSWSSKLLTDFILDPCSSRSQYEPLCDHIQFVLQILLEMHRIADGPTLQTRVEPYNMFVVVKRRKGGEGSKGGRITVSIWCPSCKAEKSILHSLVRLLALFLVKALGSFVPWAWHDLAALGNIAKWLGATRHFFLATWHYCRVTRQYLAFFVCDLAILPSHLETLPSHLAILPSHLETRGSGKEGISGTLPQRSFVASAMNNITTVECIKAVDATLFTTLIASHYTVADFTIAFAAVFTFSPTHSVECALQYILRQPSQDPTDCIAQVVQKSELHVSHAIEHPLQ